MFQQALAVSTAILFSLSFISPQNHSTHGQTPPTPQSSVIQNPASTPDSADHGNADRKQPEPEHPARPEVIDRPNTDSIPGTDGRDKQPEGVPQGNPEGQNTVLGNLGLPNCRVTQGELNHHKEWNGTSGGHIFATDIACKRFPFAVFAPKTYPYYIVQHIGFDSALGNYIILKHGDARYVFAHTQNTKPELVGGQRVEAGGMLGYTDTSGFSQSEHLHVEKWIGTNNVAMRDDRVNEFSSKLCDQRGWGFCKPTPAPKKIYRNGQFLDHLQYAYEISKGDMDFIKTIEQESRWDLNAHGDKNNPRQGDYSWGLCQLNTRWRSADIAHYKTLSPNEQVDFCYAKYSMWLRDGVINNQLYGYKVRNQPRNDIFTVK